MKLHRIRVEHVRGLAAAEVHFTDGVTIIEAPNESGKTSLFDAFDLLLREKHSTSKQEVRDLQPRGLDVGSLVEAELTLGDTRLTVRKRFNRDRLTELSITTPSPRQLTGDDAHAELRRLLETHTDLALFQAMWLRQGRALDRVELAGSSLLAQTLDASAGGSGQPGDDALYDRIVAEHDRYFTATGKPRRVLLDAEEAVVQAQGTVEELAGKQASLRDAADRLEGLEAERAELDARIAALEPKVAMHERRRARIDQLRAELDGALARQEAARTELDRATGERDARQGLIARIDLLTAQVAQRQVSADQATERLATCEAQLRSLERDVAGAEAQETQVRAKLARARDEGDLVACRNERRQCRERIERIEEIWAAGAAAEAFFVQYPADSERYEQVLRAAEQLRLCEARLKDAAPQVTLHATEPVTLSAIDAEVPLPDGGMSLADSQVSLTVGEVWEQQVSEPLQVRLGTSLELKIDPGSSLSERRAQATEAREALADACAELGVADATEAAALARQREDHHRAIEHRDAALGRELGSQRREDLTERIRSLDAQIAHLEARLSDEDGSGDARLLLVTHDTGAAVDILERDEREARDAVADARSRRTALAGEIQTLRDLATRATTELERDRQLLAESSERLCNLRAQVSDDTLNGRIPDATKTLQLTTETVAGAQQELAQLDPEEEDRLASTVAEQVATANERRDLVRDGLAAAHAAIDVHGGSGVGEALGHAQAELARRNDALDSLRSRSHAAMTLKHAFETARDEAYRTYRDPLRERIVAAARLVLRDDEDVEIELDERLAVTTRTRHGVTLPFAQLSAGAREQLAILTALAAADLAGQDGNGVPLVLDDTMGHTDPQRMERLGEVLNRVRGPQVIVLTCVGARFQTISGANVIRLREMATPA